MAQDPLQIFGPKTCGYCGQIHASGFDCRERRVTLTTIKRAEPRKRFNVLLHPASGFDAVDLAHLSERANEEIEGSGSTHCAVSKRALRRLIQAYQAATADTALSGAQGTEQALSAQDDPLLPTSNQEVGT